MKFQFFTYLTLSSVLFSTLTISNQELVRAFIVQVATKSSISTSTVNENKLIKEIANLEVEIVLLNSRYTTKSSQVTSANKKLQNLRQQLKSNSKNILNSAISKAIKEKIAELEVERVVKATAYVEHSPVLMVLAEDIKGLRQRFAQIQPRNSQALVNRTVSQSIKNKISQLRVQRAKLQNVYSRDSANIGAINEQIQHLEKRLALLK